MEQRTILKNLGWGFLPIIIFVVVDALLGTTVALLVAVGTGIGESIYFYLKEKRLDRFVLLDVGLLVVLGLLSTALQNPIFFKLKPAIIESILMILLGITAYSSNPLLLQMGKRYVKGMQFSSAQVRAFQQMARRLFWIIAAHTLLIIYAAFSLSTEMWGFISGGLFYVLMGIFLAWEWLRLHIHRKKWEKELASDEWFDIVTPEGKIIGRAPRKVVHGNPKLLHPVVHAHILNSQGQLLLQKRSPHKDLYPGKWDTAIGGHVHSGESIEKALLREAEEELGLSMPQYQPLFQYIHSNTYESELVYSFLIRDDGPFYPNREEVTEVRFWTLEEIQRNLGKDLFTPNFEQEFQLLQQFLEKFPLAGSKSGKR